MGRGGARAMADASETVPLPNRLPRASWEQRPPEIAFLLNAAFCAVVLRTATRAYVAEIKRGLPLPLAYVLLPLVLHKTTRDALPPSTRTRMLTWLATSPAARLGVPDRVRRVAPYVREALIFAVQHEVLSLDESARLWPATRRLRPYVPNAGSDAASCLSRAELLGRWFARSGDPATVLAAWGLQL